MRAILVLAAIAGFIGATTTQRVPQAVTQGAADRFSVVLDYTATGWSAACEIGCGWTAGFSCATACNAVVDARGIITLANTRPLDSLFAFAVERTDNGVSARSRWGTRWRSLSWGCEQQPCRARVTESGVAVLGR